jgi:MoaA/NifB/PqqE/SkfB family radical SAM enzyme
VIFSGSGEPFLHPRVSEFVAYAARQKGKMTTCLSNGTRLTKPHEIIKAGLTKLQVDVNGLTPEQHALYRVGSDLDMVLHNLRELIGTKKELRSGYPLVYMDVLINRHNEEDHDRFISLASKLQLNGVILAGIKDDLRHAEDWLPIEERFRPKARLERGRCDFQDKLVGILSWDGDIQLCCMTPNHPEAISRGNAFEAENLLELLDSERFLEITRKCGGYPCCDGCSLRDAVSYDKTIHFHLPWRYVLRKLRKEPRRIINKAWHGGFGRA